MPIMEKNESIGKLCHNGWVKIAVLDPNSSSIDWYRVRREHLEFAEIDPSASVTADYV